MLSSQTHQPERGKAAAALCPQIQSAGRVCSQQMYANTPVYSTHPHGCLHMWQTLRAVTWTQHQQPLLAPLSGWGGRGPLLRVCTHTSIFTYRHVQCGSLQQLGSDTHSAQELPLDPSMPNCWYLDIQAPGTAALHCLWIEQRLPLPGKT